MKFPRTWFNIIILTAKNHQKLWTSNFLITYSLNTVIRKFIKNIQRLIQIFIIKCFRILNEPAQTNLTLALIETSMLYHSTKEIIILLSLKNAGFFIPLIMKLAMGINIIRCRLLNMFIRYLAGIWLFTNGFDSVIDWPEFEGVSVISFQFWL